MSQYFQNPLYGVYCLQMAGGFKYHFYKLNSCLFVEDETAILMTVFLYSLVVITLLQVSDEADIPEDEIGTNGLDEFTRKLSEDDARVLVDLLKLAVAGRAGPRAAPAITKVLTGDVDCLKNGRSLPHVFPDKLNLSFFN